MAQFTDMEALQRGLTVHPEILRQKSGEILSGLREMRTAFEMLDRAVSRTGSYWVGEAGAACRAYAANRSPEAEEMLLRLMEHVQELNHMAAVYVKAEQEAEDIAKALPADVIM